MLHPGLSITGKTPLYQPIGVVFSALAHGRRYGDWRQQLCCRLQNFCVNRGALPSKCPRPRFLREGHKRRQSSRHSKSRVGQSHPVHSHDNEVKPKFRKFSIRFLVDFIFPFLLPANLLKTEEKHHLGWKYSSFLFSAQREGGSSFAICSHGCSMRQTSDHCGCSSPFIRDS